MKQGARLLVGTAVIAAVLSLASSCTQCPEFQAPIDGVAPGATPLELSIPPFFPPMDIPAHNPLTEEGVELGRLLFWEKTLSQDSTMSCGSCHLPERSFAEPTAFSTGVTGEVSSRNAMAIVNVGWARNYFWDGRAPTLEDQAREPVPHPGEMNLAWEVAEQRIAANPLYPPLMMDAFGSEQVSEDRIVMAIAQFMRTMVSAKSRFDQWRKGEIELTDEEFLGYELFNREGGDPEVVVGGEFGADCFHCHSEAGLQFSDYLAHNNGLDSVFSDMGVGAVTLSSLDNGRFKTPTLRNVELTGPYMHDGRFETLEEVVDHYNAGGLPSETIDPFMKYTTGGLMLPDVHKAALVAFLKTLTDPSFGENPNFSDPHQ
jgi:cytochrome c peroxidase